MNTMSARIDAIIKAKGYTLEEFGKLVGVSKGAVSKWINEGVKNLRNDHLFAIEDKTGYSARWIATGEGEPMAQKCAEPAQRYSRRAQAVVEMFEELDEDGKGSIEEDIEKEKRLKEMKKMLAEFQKAG